MRRLTAIAALLALSGCGVAVRQAAHGYREVRYSSLFAQGRRGPLTPAQIEWAKTAWKYFQTNTEGGTGVANGLEKVPVASVWNIGDYVAALCSAKEIGILPEVEFTNRLVNVIRFLNSMELFDKRLPNLNYNTQTGVMVSAANTPEETGWSAIDMGRLLVWLRIASLRVPILAEYIDKAILRWKFCAVLDGAGSLYAGRKHGEAVEVVQEGRLGYEEYAALGFQAWGFNTDQASRIDPYGKVLIEGVEVSYDSRDPRLSKTFAPVVTLPHVLLGMEFNWGGIDSRHYPATERPLARIAQAVYEAQEARFDKEHILTARTDHPLNRSPGFIYDTVFLGGYPWNTVTPDGTFVPYEALVSTRAAFGLWVLWRTGYTDLLMESTLLLQDKEHGWYEGRYEKTGGPETTLSSTTNAVVLEALAYQATGRLFRNAPDQGYYSLAVRSEFTDPAVCLPQKR